MSRPPRPAAALLLVCCVVAGALTGCTGGGSAGSSASSSSAAAASGAATRDVSATAPPPRPTPTPVPTWPVLTLGDDHLDSGGNDEGTFSWDVWAPTVTGGGGAADVAATAQRRVDSSVAFGVQRSEEGGGGPHYLTGDSEVVTNDGRTLQVRVTFTDTPADGSEPTDSVTTVALRTADGKPVFLADTLADPDAAWKLLADRFTAVAAAQGATPTRPLEATAGQFADWQTSQDGLEVSFQAGEIGPGAPLFVVPWKDVRPLLTADGEALLAP